MTASQHYSKGFDTRMGGPRITVPVDTAAVVAFVKERAARSPTHTISLPFVAAHLHMRLPGVRNVCQKQNGWELRDVGFNGHKHDLFIVVPVSPDDCQLAECAEHVGGRLGELRMVGLRRSVGALHSDAGKLPINSGFSVGNGSTVLVNNKSDGSLDS